MSFTVPGESLGPGQSLGDDQRWGGLTTVTLRLCALKKQKRKMADEGGGKHF